MKTAFTAGFMTLALVAGAPDPSATTIVANDNTKPAGTLRNGVLTVSIDATTGMWFPHTRNDPGMPLQAFAERGHAPAIPGPMIRVPAGTVVDLSIRNAIPRASLVLHGLLRDSISIASGETRRVRFNLDRPGTYFYWGTTTGRAFVGRLHEDAQLSGAIIVDDSVRNGAYKPPRDRILVIGFTGDTIGSATQRESPKNFLLSVNGLSWPHTERLEYNLSDTIRWRIINASAEVHPMHLHGTYYTIESRGNGVIDSLYRRSRRETANTDFMLPGTTMMVSWKPGHPGNWLFHCHIPEHFGPRGPRGELIAEHTGGHSNHAADGMSGLVVGVTVKEPAGYVEKPLPQARHNLRLLLRPNRVAANGAASYGFVFGESNDAVSLAGPPIILARDEPVAITVANKSDAPAAVHWHGIELESYFDGVPGFSGIGSRLTPLVAPNDSFIARFTPPRAGTFMYHTHVGEGNLKVASLVGMIIVLEPGAKYDRSLEIPLLISSPTNAEDEDRTVLLNGEPAPSPITLERGRKYRIRLGNITARRPGIFAQIVRDSVLARWRPIAKDGADLPIDQQAERPARRRISIGETMDFEIAPDSPGVMMFQIVTANGKLLNSIRLDTR